ADGGVLVGRVRPVNEDVEAVPVDRQAQRQGIGGALLAEQALERFEVVGGVERERSEIATLVQLVGVDASPVVGHDLPLSGPRPIGSAGPVGARRTFLGPGYVLRRAVGLGRAFGPRERRRQARNAARRPAVSVASAAVSTATVTKAKPSADLRR